MCLACALTCGRHCCRHRILLEGHLACAPGLARISLSLQYSKQVSLCTLCAAGTRLRRRGALQVLFAWPKQACVWDGSPATVMPGQNLHWINFYNSCAPLFGRLGICCISTSCGLCPQMTPNCIPRKAQGSSAHGQVHAHTCAFVCLIVEFSASSRLKQGGAHARRVHGRNKLVPKLGAGCEARVRHRRNIS